MTLPPLIGLCANPAHAEDFCWPLDPGDSHRCPVAGCEHELVIYAPSASSVQGTDRPIAREPADSSPATSGAGKGTATGAAPELQAAPSDARRLEHGEGER